MAFDTFVDTFLQLLKPILKFLAVIVIAIAGNLLTVSIRPSGLFETPLAQLTLAHIARAIFAVVAAGITIGAILVVFSL